MMNFKRHISLLNKIGSVFFAAIIIAGCGQEQKETEYVARVNDAYLTKAELSSLIDINSSSTFHKSEIIRNWINREILFQEAVKDGILDKDEYKKVIKDSERELAGTLLLNQYVSSRTINFELKDILTFFENNRNDFKLANNSYLLNIIHFTNEDRAVEFRSLVLDSDWQKALIVFYGDSTIVISKSKTLIQEQDIYTEKVLRVVKRLYPLEISIVISDREGYYTVVQVLAKYTKGSLPSFDYIRPEVEKRYLAKKKKELIENYIKDLYSNNNIEVIH
jgi:hypothetical protein